MSHTIVGDSTTSHFNSPIVTSMIDMLETLEQRAAGHVRVSALRGGTFTLPLHLFVSGVSTHETTQVPSLSFLLEEYVIGHATKSRTVLFDLGLRRDTSSYASAIQQHLKNRQPLDATHDVLESLKTARFPPQSIDEVILSHVHWDHIGTPTDFSQARFIVGAGSLDLLRSQSESHLSHSNFQHDLFNGLNVCELPDLGAETTGPAWACMDGLQIYDMYGNGIIYAVNSPGHLIGHIALLARRGVKSWVLLIGDACHDARLLTGEGEIAEWLDKEGRTCCIHADKGKATQTLQRFAQLKTSAEAEGFSLEIVFAHDRLWAQQHVEAFLPGSF